MKDSNLPPDAPLSANMQKWNPVDDVPVIRLQADDQDSAAYKRHLQDSVASAQVWQAAQSRTRIAMYASLGNVYDYLLRMLTLKGTKLDEMRDAIREMIAETYPNGTYKKSRQTDTMLVALVVGENKKDVSRYVKVLRKAAISGAEAGFNSTYVPVEHFVDWVKASSGITAIGNTSGTGKTTEVREDTASVLKTMPTVETVALPKCESLSIDEVNTPVVLLGVYLGEGKFEVKGFVKSRTASSAALDAYRTENKKQFTPA